MEKINWTDYIKKMFDAKGYIDLHEAAKYRFGIDSVDNVKKMYNIFYFSRKFFSDDKGLIWKNVDGIIKFTPASIADTPFARPSAFSPPVQKEKAFKPRTMVIVVKQVEDSVTVEILGDNTRAMMKEVMKQMMEAII